jgi:hypothetical protein
MRDRGFRAAWHFYRAHFWSVVTVSAAFYLALAVLAEINFAELGYYSAATVSYLVVVSIFWLQAPIAQLMKDVHAGQSNPGVRRTFQSLYPRLGAVTRGSLLAGVGVWVAAGLLVVPGLLLLARWALLIPVIVIEGVGALRGFSRSSDLVSQHTGRVVVELLVSAVILIVIWLVAVELWRAIGDFWVSTPLILAFLTLTTPPIPLMRTLSYYDLLDAARKRDLPVAPTS